MADDLGIRTFENSDTPHLDDLAEEGKRFDFAHAMPLCTPSRVQIMTGQYNFRNYTRFGELRPGETTFAHLLRGAGYRTSIVGKWQLGGDISAPNAFGFDDYCLWQLTYGGYNERYHNPRLIKNGKLETYTDGEYGPDLFLEHAKAFMRSDRAHPFFLYYPMVLPHRPNLPVPDSPDYAELISSERGVISSHPKYLSDQVTHMDQIVGELVQFLKDEGLAESTLVIFTTDNGTSTEVSVPYKDRMVNGQKGRTNLLGTHVPLIAWWPEHIHHGISSRMVDFTDFLPTLVEAGGASLPTSMTMDGMSFYADLLDESGPQRDWIFCHYAPGKKSFPDTRFVFDREWKVYEEGNLYNVSEDPLEEHPVDFSTLSKSTQDRINHLKTLFSQLK